MSSAPEIVTFRGVEYYEVDGVKYHPQFPYEWALSNDGETGPKNCLNCVCYGVKGGLFIGYCANCRSYYEEEDVMHVSLHDYENEVIWSQYPYMTGVDLYTVGWPDYYANEIDEMEEYSEDEEENVDILDEIDWA
jgi:hypothetical protein